MNRQRETPGRAPGLNVGSASIVMVFAVLCLTVFAVLSLLTARSELALAQRAADAVTDYYAADCLAVDVYDALAAAETLPAGVEVLSALGRHSYAVPIDENQSLCVVLQRQEDGSLQVEEWSVYMTGEWLPDNNLNLFMMNEDPILGLG